MEWPPWQRNAPQIGLDDTNERLGGEPAPEPGGQCRIPLDGDDARTGAGERAGQGAEPGPQIEDQIPGAGATGADQLRDQPAVSQEVRSGRVRRRWRPPWHGRT